MINIYNISFSNDSLVGFLTIIVAMFIPLGIFLLSKGNNRYAFDTKVILKDILCAEELASLISILLLLILFEINIPLTTFFALIFFLLFLRSLDSSYKWITSFENDNTISFQQKKRINFLESISSSNEFLEIFSVILNDKDFREKNQKGFLNILISKLKEQNSNFDSQRRLLTLMHSNIDKFDFSNDQDLNNFIDFLLEDLNKNSQESLDLKKRNFLYLKQYIFFQLLKLSLQKNTKNGDKALISDFSFFRKFVNSFKEKEVKNDKLFNEFFLFFIKEIIDNKYDIEKLWEDYDLQEIFSISSDDIVGSNKYKKGIIKVYKNWLYSVINFDDKKTNHIIDELTNYIFPNINNIYFFDILTLFLNPDYEMELILGDDYISLLKKWSNDKRNFGNSSRSIIHTTNINDFRELLQQRERNTLEILNFIFEQEKQRCNLNTLIEEAEILFHENKDKLIKNKLKRLVEILKYWRDEEL